MQRGYDIAVLRQFRAESLPMYKMLLHSGALTTVIIFVVLQAQHSILKKLHQFCPVSILVHPYNQYRQTTRNSIIT